MSQDNEREEARVYLKKLVDFNFKTDYYQQDKKNEVARDLRKLLFVDDQTVRHFLEKWVEVTRALAIEFDLVGTDSEVQHADEEQSPETEAKEAEESENAEQEDKQTQTTEEQPKEETTTEEKPEGTKIPKLPENVLYSRASQLVEDLYFDNIEDNEEDEED